MLCAECVSFFHKIVFIIPEMFVLIINKVQPAIYKDFDSQGNSSSTFSLNFPTFVNFFFLSIFKQFIILKYSFSLVRYQYK